jgi:hypothetical protein
VSAAGNGERCPARLGGDAPPAALTPIVLVVILPESIPLGTG